MEFTRPIPTFVFRIEQVERLWGKTAPVRQRHKTPLISNSLSNLGAYLPFTCKVSSILGSCICMSSYSRVVAWDPESVSVVDVEQSIKGWN